MSVIILFFIVFSVNPLTDGYNLKITKVKIPQSSQWSHQDGWPVTFEVNYTHFNQIYDSVICDLESDNNLDVVVTYTISETESYIDAYELNGIEKTDLGFPFKLPGKILCEASVGDLDKDGDMEIIAGISVFTDAFHTTIYVFEYDGEKFIESWHYMVTKKSGEIIHSPTLGDVDGDGDLEIIIGNQRYDNEWIGVVYAFHHDGKMVSGWPVTSKFKSGSYYSTPALDDIDNDGFLEVVVGTYFEYLYAWNGNGKLVSYKWPVNLPDDIRAHSPQLGDLDADGEIEVVQIGTKLGELYIIDGRGNIIRTINSDIADFSCTPGLGDIDGDGDLEIFTSIGDYIYGWHHDGEKVAGLWPVFIYNNAHSSRASVIIGDIDGDHNPDILFMRENSEDGSDIFAFHSDGTLINGWPYSFDEANSLRSSPSLIDIDKDGDLELAFTYSYQPYPTNPSKFTIDILDINTSYDETTMHWPMFQHDPQHTGSYKKPGNNPPEKPIIDGPVNGNVRTEYTYTACTNDPDCDNISYLFDWGDGTNSGWTEFVLSGTVVNQSHKWWWSNIFEVKVKAKDSYGAQSEWAFLKVTMPRNKVSTYLWFFQFIERIPLLERLFSLLLNFK